MSRFFLRYSLAVCVIAYLIGVSYFQPSYRSGGEESSSFQPAEQDVGEDIQKVPPSVDQIDPALKDNAYEGERKPVQVADVSRERVDFASEKRSHLGDQGVHAQGGLRPLLPDADDAGKGLRPLSNFAERENGASGLDPGVNEEGLHEVEDGAGEGEVDVVNPPGLYVDGYAPIDAEIPSGQEESTEVSKETGQGPPNRSGYDAYQGGLGAGAGEPLGDGGSWGRGDGESGGG
ncbi:unnamed protein product, partial [Discosporangium mesarthrocarpum]